MSSSRRSKLSPGKRFPDLEPVVADAETFYGQEYSLRSKDLSTSLYIRDERFKEHCWSIWRPLSEPFPRIYWYDEIDEALDQLDWKGSRLICHHTHFDGLILSHHHQKVPAKYGCTMSMSRAWHGSHSRSDLDSICQHYGVGGKLVDIGNIAKNVGHFSYGGVARALFGDYCKHDVLRTWEIYCRMLEEGFPEPELELVHRCVAMFADPILQVDRVLARSELKREREERAATIEESGEVIGDLRSRETFAALLRDLGVEPPQKINKKGEVTYAFAKTDASFKALTQHENPEVAALVEAKLVANSSIGETRAQALLDRSLRIHRAEIEPDKRNLSKAVAPLPIYINYAKAHTLRMSGGDAMNAQNFPSKARGGKSSQIRATIKAPPGCVLVVVDSSQIEARMNGALAGETWLLEAFRAKRDVYCEQAADVYRRPINKKDDPDERFLGKVCVLMLGYGASAPKLKYTLALGTMGPPVFISLELSQTAVAAYRHKNAAIVAQWDKLGALIRTLAYGTGGVVPYGPMTFEKGVIHMPGGLRLFYPNLRYEQDEKTGKSSWFYDQGGNKVGRLYGGALDENVVQSLARICVYEQASTLDYRMVMTSHDEAVFCVPRKQADKCLSDAIKAFSRPPIWMPEIPVTAEGAWAVQYDK